jgi:hypothetical protein
MKEIGRLFAPAGRAGKVVSCCTGFRGKRGDQNEWLSSARLPCATLSVFIIVLGMQIPRLYNPNIRTGGRHFIIFLRHSPLDHAKHL